MSTLQLQALAIIFAGWVNRAQQDVIVSVLRTLPRSTIRRIGLESRSITRPMSRASMVRSGRGRGRPTRRDTASTRSDESFPDRPVNSLIAPILFPVHTRREFDSTCAKSLRNLSPFGAETTRICRKSLHFPVDQGIRCRDGFATDSPHRHQVCPARDESGRDRGSARKARVCGGVGGFGIGRPTGDSLLEGRLGPNQVPDLCWRCRRLGEGMERAVASYSFARRIYLESGGARLTGAHSPRNSRQSICWISRHANTSASERSGAQ